jgi:flavin-dependent dehydrogenase
MKIAIVGGGSAGFVAALILKQTYPKLIVDVIKSDKIGTIGVGEGSTEHWREFMEYVGISNTDIITNCDATYKAGIRFENWTDKDYIQLVEGNFTDKYLDNHIIYSYLASKEVEPIDLLLPLCPNNQVALAEESLENIKNAPTSQYHFNTHKLNVFLTDLALSRGIKVYDDEIKEVCLDKDGNIDVLKGKNLYNYDFYIDCTGFSKLLINKLGAEWTSHKDYLKVNSAIVFPTENEDYPMWTLARAMDAGWMFRIPVWGRKGNGYIFDKNYITTEQAKKEVEEYLGHSIEITKHIEFEPGCISTPWIKNCCAIGLSSSFIEPLEATSIGTSIQQSFLLASRIFNYTQDDIDTYNKEFNDIIENIRDFVLLHYLTDRDDTEFWKDYKNVELPKSLKKHLTMFKNRMPVNSDFGHLSDKILFVSMNYFIVMYSLGLVDQKSIKKQFNMLPDNIQKYAEQHIKEMLDTVKNSYKLSHKTVLSMIRDIYK